MPEESEGSIISRPVLHHVNLKTTRLQEMIDWYTIVVGMETLFQFPGGAWLSNDTANHRLALLTSPLMSDDFDKLAHTGIHHFAFEYRRTTSATGRNQECLCNPRPSSRQTPLANSWMPNR